eukprot:COSAG05_NODE_654_length_8069_cov_3.646926_9_plen_248_part_00
MKLWLCGPQYGLITRLERAEDNAKSVVHQLFYGSRSGLIAKVVRGARQEAENAFRAAEVDALLSRTQVRDSIGVFKEPGQPSPVAKKKTEGSSKNDVAEVSGPLLFWWATFSCVKKAVIRQDSSLKSQKVCSIKPGQIVQVTAIRDVGEIERVRCTLGWLSIKSSAGNTLLKPLDNSNSRPVAAAPRLSAAERWALEEAAQRSRRLDELKSELRALSLEVLQRRAINEGIGAAALISALDGSGTSDI